MNRLAALPATADNFAENFARGLARLALDNSGGRLDKARAVAEMNSAMFAELAGAPDTAENMRAAHTDDAAAWARAVDLLAGPSEPLRRAFAFHRRPMDGGPTRFAKEALALARKDAAAGVRRDGPAVWANGRGNVGAPDAQGVRWIENPAAVGLRFVGYADKLANLDHTGWFSDADGSSKIRGVVFQLPGRDGRPRFYCGHDNEDNGEAENGGPARVDLAHPIGPVWDVERECARRSIGPSYWMPYMERAAYWAEAATETARKDAARQADGMAEKAADEQREYNTAWQAGVAWAEEAETIARARRDILALVPAIRRARRESSLDVALLIATGKAAVEAALGTICGARERQGKLAAGDAAQLYFYPSEELKAAFCDGAGLAKFPR